MNLRCHERYDLECKKETTLILGENGCGKTSVLEAIYEGTRGKSFRAVDRELVRRGAEFYRVEIMRWDGEKVVVSYDGQKNFEVGGKKYKRLPKKYKYPVILFEPTNLNLMAASPGRRRDYFDAILAQLDEDYAAAVTKYEKALRQRNEILKQGYIDEAMLFPWDIMLARLGVKIRQGRSELVRRINKVFNEKYHSIADNEDEVRLDYGTTTAETEEQYLIGMAGTLEKDRVLGYSNYGVHRDDFCFVFNGCMADGSASRGEVRSIILALKFIEADLIEEVLRRKPVILLDDVFSELDEKRQEALKNNFKNNQIIITSVK